MSVREAKEVFATMMQLSRKRQLTPREKSELSAARQTLRQAKKPARNPESKVRKSNPSNATKTKIYGRILRIEAQKTQPHICDAECKRANHCYFHDFTTKNAMIFGMPDGSLRIQTK